MADDGIKKPGRAKRASGPVVPDLLMWDFRASGDDVRGWVTLAIAEPYGPVPHVLGEVGDKRAADALRESLTVEHPAVLSMVVRGLGRSGAPGDAALLEPLLQHEDAHVRAAVRSSLIELGVPGVADLLFGLLDDLDEDSQEAGLILDGLAWLRDERALVPLRRRLAARQGRGNVRLGRFELAQALTRMGDEQDRRRLAQGAINAVRAAAESDVRDELWEAKDVWRAYEYAVGPVAAEEVDLAWAALDALPEPIRRVTSSARVNQESAAATPPKRAPRPREPIGPRTVARRAMTGFEPVPPENARRPPAKFCGQPDWRDSPAWPVTADGRPLTFYGQLPLPGPQDLTAYVFVTDDESWEPLGPGNAVVVQPGNSCHLTTIPEHTGPQIWVRVGDDGGYRQRTGNVPAPDKFVVFEDGADPVEWSWPPPRRGVSKQEDNRDWNKIGGSPIWLQSEETPPGDGWAYAAQFSASRTGGELADGAECYLWTREDGKAAFGWQCH